MKKIKIIIALLFFASVALAQNAPIDFEAGGYGANWTWTVFENFPNPPLEIINNPDPSGINTSATVAKFTAMQTGQPFAGAESAHGNSDLGPFVLDETNNVIKIMVWKPVISDVGIKLASSTGWSQGELKVANTLINQWEELTFDFSGFINPPDPELGLLDQIIIFPDFDLSGRTQNNIVYFDNITFNSQSDATLSDLKVNGTTVAGFSPSILNYSVVLPEGTTQVPAVTATTSDPLASFVVNPTFILPGATNVIVTSADGSITKTYTVAFSVQGETPLSEYCETQVWHLGNPAEAASTIFLTIENTGTNSMIVEIESANADPVDFLLVAGGSGAVISDENTSVPGKISRTLSWGGTPPEEVVLNVLWSKESFTGNWQLSAEDIAVPFAAICTFEESFPRNPIDFEAGGYGANWTWTVFENFPNPPLEIINNPDPSGINTSATVAKFTAMETGQPFAGVESAHGNSDLGPFVLDETNNQIKIMVWKPVISDVGIKLASSTGWSQGELKVANTLINQWEELTFDFSDFINPPDPELGMLDQIVIFPDFDLSGRTQDNIIYFDNITFNPQGDATLSDLKVDGETVEGFDPSITSYSLMLPEGTTQVPVVTATANDPQAGVAINPAPSLPGTTDVVVTAANGNVTKTYSVSFAVEGETPLSAYCETQVWHLGNPAEAASTIFLTIENSGINSMIVEIESANADPVDFLLVAGGSGAVISDENTSVPGKISRILSWGGTPPEEVVLNVLWSKESFAGNWQLSAEDIAVPFAAVCEITEPKPYLALNVQDNFEDDGSATIPAWKFEDPTLVDLQILQDPENPDNNVAGYNRSGSYEYTNAQFILDHRMNLTTRNRFEMKVYFPSSNNYENGLTPTAAIKLQNSLLGGNAYSTQTEIVQPITQFDEWITIEFNFIDARDSINYDKVVVQLGGEGHLAPGQFYFDDFRLLPRPSVMVANFSATPLTGSAPLTVQFTDLTTGSSPSSWQWDFDNDGIIDSQEKNPTHTYETPGTYSVYFKASNVIFNDNITRYNYITVNKPLLALDVQDNFENDGYSTIPEWFFQDPDNEPLSVVADPLNTENNVAEYDRSGVFEWTNAQFKLNHFMDLSERNEFEMKAYFPSSNDYSGSLLPKVELKLQNSQLGEFAYTTQSVASHTVTQFDRWITLVFDFSFVADSINYDQVIVQFGGEGHLEPGLFYFDDLLLLGGADPLEQTIEISSGWSGISSYVIPQNSEIETLLGGLDNLTIIYGDDGIYYPQGGINTLQNWDASKGYIIKTDAAEEILFQGLDMTDPSIQLEAGWSVIPVISSCPVDVAALLAGNENIVMVKAVAGLKLFWPEKGINTLPELMPGKSYLIMTNAPVTITFPDCNSER